MNEPVITVTTDFGLADHYVAAMKGVILGICPKARLIDISHDLTPFSISEGAYTLAQAWKYFPAGTVHLAVVDPGVGTERRAIAAEVAGHRFVAPDNGLLTMVLESARAPKLREITATRYFRNPVSSTFHGRDIFAPIAAHLANGLNIARVGKAIADPVIGEFAKPIRLAPNQWRGSILKIDRFGNIITNLSWSEFDMIASADFRLKLGRRYVTHFCQTFASAPAGQLSALKGSSGYLEVFLSQSSAATALRLAPGTAVELTIRSGQARRW
jgi:S-adenosylmethionine hydrolase